jgi:asparagine synthetase B (glutamine-hydrolysing)
LNVLRRQLACSDLSSDPPREKRYPFLDRGLLEFLTAIPPEQLVRPGQRRSLMRRALIGIVPDEVLNRKRKAFVVRGPMVGIAAEWPHLLELGENMALSSLGIADSSRFVEALQKTRQGTDVPIVPLMRTIGIEFWLQNLNATHVLANAAWRTREATKQALSQTDDANPITSNVD